LSEEEQPDATRIKGWLVRAKEYLNLLKLGSDVLQKAKEVFEAFDVPFMR
jgi:hypothetical protein